MKKKNFKNLELNKKSISVLDKTEKSQVKGRGVFTCSVCVTKCQFF